MSLRPVEPHVAFHSSQSSAAHFAATVSTSVCRRLHGRGGLWLFSFPVIELVSVLSWVGERDAFRTAQVVIGEATVRSLSVAIGDTAVSRRLPCHLLRL